MKRIKFILSISIIMVMMILVVFSVDAISSSHWAIDYVDYVLAQGFMSGTRSTFSENSALTRGETVHALGVMHGISTGPGATTGFTDVPYSHTYAKEVKWAKENGIVSGVTPTMFYPGNNVTRQDFTVICYNYANYAGISLPTDYQIGNLAIVTYGNYQLPNFTDKADIADYAKPAVLAMYQAGIIGGYSDGTFMPTQNVTKAEAASMLTSLCALKITDDEEIAVFVKDPNGNACVSAMVYCYPSSGYAANVAQYYKDYAKGTSPKKGVAIVGDLSSTDDYGVNATTKSVSGFIDETIETKRKMRFIEIPENLYDRAPITGFTRGHWAHGTCYEPTWAYNDAFCPSKIVSNSQNFAWRYYTGRGFHQGIDISCQEVNVYHIGNAGKITQICRSNDPYYGNYIQIKFDDNTYVTYQHLKTIPAAFHLDLTISTNTCIGVSGNTGTGTGYHLHITTSINDHLYPEDYDDYANFFDTRVYID